MFSLFPVASCIQSNENCFCSQFRPAIDYELALPCFRCGKCCCKADQGGERVFDSVSSFGLSACSNRGPGSTSKSRSEKSCLPSFDCAWHSTPRLYSWCSSSTAPRPYSFHQCRSWSNRCARHFRKHRIPQRLPQLRFEPRCTLLSQAVERGFALHPFTSGAQTHNLYLSGSNLLFWMKSYDLPWHPIHSWFPLLL